MKKAKLLSLFLAGSLLFQTAGIDAMATAPSEPVSISEAIKETDDDFELPTEEDQPSESEEIVPPSVEEENPELPPEGGEVTSPDEEEENPELPPEGGEATSPDEEEENPELPPEDAEVKDPVEEDAENTDSVSENTVSENTISENSLPEDETSIFSIFPGLGDNYTFSSQQLADKKVLSSHVGDVVQIQSKETATLADYQDSDGVYAPGEVVYLTESQEEAQHVAAAFGGSLDSYSYGVAVIDLPEKATVALAIAAAAEPDIKLPAVWPNYYQYLHEDTNATVAAFKPQDPDYGLQWMHDYIGTSYAWAAGYKGQGVKVAVIDTGLDASHEDLSANAKNGKNFVNGAAGTDYSKDNQTHGTHVAGIIAADDNSAGGRGIAPDATVSGYCVFPAQGGAEAADVKRAIRAAADDGYDIINMSLGSPRYDADYEKIVKSAYEEKGVAIFASSGNDDTDGYNFPAAYAGTISVGAVDQNSSRASFSNYGKTVTLSFPGVQIYSTANNGYTDEYGTTWGSYGYMSGTSQASPAAAGTAAVLLSSPKGEEIRKKTGKARVDALLAAMKSSTTKCSTSGMGAGTTYLPGVLKLSTDMTAPDAPTIEVVNEADYQRGKNKKDYIAKSIDVTLAVKTAVGVDIYYSTDGKTPTYKNGVITNAASETPYKLGDPITLTDSKSKTIKAIAVNPVSGKVSKAASKTVTLTPIPDGVTVAPTGNVKKIVAGKSLKFTATVTPSYAISNKVAWTVVDADGKDAKAKGVTVTNGTVKTSSTKTLKTPAGKYTVKATAVGSTDLKNFNGQVGSYDFEVIESSTVKKVAFIDPSTKKAPKAKSIKTTDSKSADTENKEINLAEYLTVTKAGATAKEDSEITGDEALAAVVWSSSNEKIATVSDKGVISAVAPGKAVIKATSNDGNNKSASYNVTVIQPVMNIIIDGPEKVAAGKGIALTATVSPSNAKNKKVNWTISGDGKTVSINKTNGKITTKKDATGTYTITAAAADNLGAPSATYEIMIANEEITKITLNKNKLTMFPPATSATQNTTAALEAKVEGKVGSSTKAETLANPLIKWTSSAPSIAAVDQKGNITAKAPGKTTITCAATDGSNKKATCAVTVTTPMSKLVIGPTDGNNGDVAIGKKIKMAAKYYSNYGTPNNKKIVWQIYGYGDKNLSGKVSINKNNGTVSIDKNMKPDDLNANSYVGIQAVAQDGSGVVSNIYPVSICPNYIAAQIVFLPLDDNSYSGYYCIVGTAYKIESGKNKGKPDWSKSEPINDYCTATVTGPKNSGLSKQYNSSLGCALYQPLPTNSTSLLLDEDFNDNVDPEDRLIHKLKINEFAKMSLTIKLKDGSNLTAKENNIYAICYPKKLPNGKTTTVVGYFELVRK